MFATIIALVVGLFVLGLIVAGAIITFTALFSSVEAGAVIGIAVAGLFLVSIFFLGVSYKTVEQHAVESEVAPIVEVVKTAQSGFPEPSTQVAPKLATNVDSYPELELPVAESEEEASPSSNHSPEPSWIRDAAKTVKGWETSSSGVVSGWKKNRLIASSGRWVTPEEAREEAMKVLSTALNAKLASAQPAYSTEPQFNLSDTDVNRFILDEYQDQFDLELSDQSVSAEMYRCHFLVDISPEQFNSLTDKLRAHKLTYRLKVAGTAIVGIVLASGLMGFIAGRKKRSTSAAAA